MSNSRTGRLAYLISQYPAINHRLMLREVLQLRTRGWDIQTFSISLPDRPVEELSPEEAAEYARTLYVKTAGVSTVLKAHLAYGLRHLLPYVQGLLFAAGLGHRTPALMLRRILYFAEAVVLGQWIQQRGLKHLHTHYSSTVALLVSQLYPITFSFTVHGSDEVQDPVGFALREKIRAARLVVGVSHYAKSQMMRFTAPEDWTRLEVCRTGTPATEVVLRGPRPAGAPLRLLSVARLAPIKGHHVLVAAASLLASEGRRFRLSIVGGGPGCEPLRKEIIGRNLSTYITLEGWAEEERLREFYQEADIFILPSFSEGVPVVLMEAMMEGLPCVATYVGGVPELIENSVDGLLAVPGDERDLARILARLMDSAELRQQLGEAARQKVLRRFHLERNTALLATIFRERLKDRIDP